ncbi:hypothetical protein SNE40_008258 [Patella caerulea]
MRNIKLYFEGKGKSHWEVKQGRSKTDYRAQESYINYTIILFGAANTTSEHPAGSHFYPFSLRLAPNLPSSFEGKRGYVRYFCKATIDRPWKFDENTKRAFTVIHHLDLNASPEAGYPIYAEQEESIAGCCCSDGSISAVLSINKKGYVPGEPLNYSIHVDNRSDKNIERMLLELKQDVTYTGYSSSLFSSGNPKTHVKSDVFCLFSGTRNVNPNNSEDINQTATIPALPPSNLDGCGIIDIQYTLVLTVSVGWSTLEIEKEIIIGTIPLHIPMAVPSFPSVVPPGTMATAPPLEPPPYVDPPPAYEDCVFGGANIRDENDDEHTTGLSAWTPAYPYYHWGENGPPPIAVPSAPPPAYNQV